MCCLPSLEKLESWPKFCMFISDYEFVTFVISINFPLFMKYWEEFDVCVFYDFVSLVSLILQVAVFINIYISIIGSCIYQQNIYIYWYNR